MSGITPVRVQTAAALRDLVHAFAGSDVDDATLRGVGDLVGRARDLLADAPRRVRAVPDFETLGQMRAAGRDPAVHALGDRAVAGPANPTAVDLVARSEDGEVVADVCFGPAFEGAPGRVHGGIVAAVLDDVLGMAMALARSPGFTGRLTVHYRAPVPVEERIEFRARIGQQEGRKLLVHAQGRLGDRVLVEAEAVFVLVDPKHFATHARDLLQRS